MKKILTVVGTRPNFIKITQFPRALKNYPEIEYRLCHTGQHFDKNMSDIFFKELKIPEPDYYLGIKPSTTVTQLAEIMQGLEKVIYDYKPDIVLVPGDVNSTFAAAFTAHKMDIPVGHIESGLRSFDRTMPEENNRILTDAISEYLFITEDSGMENLMNEGLDKEKIHFVGNTMIDTLVAYQENIDHSNILEKLTLKPSSYALMTMHRPATVDTNEGLQKLLLLIKEITVKMPLVFPVHPRTLKNLKAHNMLDEYETMNNLISCEPMGYLDFQNLTKNSKLVLTDSGGIQEETTFYKVPCITLRENTERPSTVDLGSNTLVYFDMERIINLVDDIIAKNYKKGAVPELWDGKATERIVDILVD